MSVLGAARVIFTAETADAHRGIAEVERAHAGATRSIAANLEKQNAATLRVTLAQRRYQDAVRRSGAESNQAVSALIRFREAQERIAGSSRHAGSEMGRFGRDVEHAGFGIAVGSKAVHGLRSALFFSASGLAGFGLSSALRAARDAALEQQASLGQLQAALNAAGLAESAYTGRVKDTIDANQRLGFSEDDTVRSLSLAVRSTRDVEKAHHLQAVAADVARGRNMSLVAATQLLVRVQAGQVGSLRRLGIDVGKGITGTQALARVQAQYAGAAATYADSAAGAQARLNIAVHQTEASVGRALLPTITNLNGRLAKWLDNSRNQERIQADVNRAVRVGGEVARDLSGALRTVEGVTGGLHGTLELLIGLRLGSVLFGWAGRAERFSKTLRGVAGAEKAVAEANVAGEIASIGGAAATATGQVSLLRGALLAIPFARIGAVGGIVAAASIARDAIVDVRNNKAELARQVVLSRRNGVTVYGRQGRIYSETVPFGGGQPIRVDITATPQGRRDLLLYQQRIAERVARDRVRQAFRDNPLDEIPTEGVNPGRGGASAPPRRPPLSLQGRFNLAALRLAEAGLTPGTRDDEKALDDEARILRQQIAREKNLAKKTAFAGELQGVLGQLQQITDDRTRQATAQARRRQQARQRARAAAARAATAAERQAFGRVTDTLQGLTSQARAFAGRGQYDQERRVLHQEEHELEQFVNDTSLSLAHRRQLRRQLATVRQRITSEAQRQQALEERRRFGQVTGVLQGLAARATRQRGRGQLEADRATLRVEEHDLERLVRDTTLSLEHRRQLRGRLNAVRQQIDNLTRDIRTTNARAAAARAERPGLLISRAEARAALTETTDDDLRAYRSEENLIKRRLAALGRLKHLTNQQLRDETDLLNQQKSVRDKINELSSQSKAGQGQAFLRELSGELGLFASNIAPRTGAVPSGSRPIVQNLHFHRPVSAFAAQRAAREAAMHYPVG